MQSGVPMEEGVRNSVCESFRVIHPVIPDSFSQRWRTGFWHDASLWAVGSRYRWAGVSFTTEELRGNFEGAA